jgi:DNA-binding transcriptional ArsR family regulator
MLAPNPKRDLFAALAHPVRHGVLALLLKSKETLSPTQISDTLFEPLSNVSYHVRKLKEQGLVELVDTQPTRGSLEHRYGLSDQLRANTWARETLEDATVPDVLPPLDHGLDRDSFECDGPEVLDEREREVVGKHYGYGGHRKQGRREIGEGMELSEAQVRTIERQALRKLELARRERESSG